jgi:predicted XRE-type DNA-binding protein
MSEEDFSLDEWEKVDDLEQIQNTLDLQDQALGNLLEKVEQLNNKVVNLATKLNDHLHEPDAHNAALLHRKKK